MSHKSIDEYPLCLSVDDIAEITDLSRSKAYELCHSEYFPCVRVGRRMIVPKAAFVRWMENPHRES